ncbi:MAG: M17 family peptidase N-terminal domain-containing protein [Myxococcota bacterium]
MSEGPPELRAVPAALRALDDHPGEVLVLPVFADERPLPGLAGLVDWRMCGALSQWLMGGFATGAAGEQVLCPTRGRLSHRLILLLGLGVRSEHRTDRACAAARQAADAVQGLGARQMTCGLFGLERLPSPLERSLPELLDALRDQEALDRVDLAVAPDVRDVVEPLL